MSAITAHETTILRSEIFRGGDNDQWIPILSTATHANTAQSGIYGFSFCVSSSGVLCCRQGQQPCYT